MDKYVQYLNVLSTISSIVFGAGIFWKVLSIAEKIGEWKQWITNVEVRLAKIDKEMNSNGTMLQQQGLAISHVEGRLDDGRTQK